MLTGSGGHSHADICVDECLAPCGYDGDLGRVDVVASCEGAAACGQAGLVGELLDEETGCLAHLGDGDGGAVVVLCGCVGVGGGSRFVRLDAFRWGRARW